MTGYPPWTDKYVGEIQPPQWTYHSFSIYILECAIRDRQTYIDAITPQFGEPDPETEQQIIDTSREIHAMRGRLRKLQKKDKP
jgi:hypothetical protein